MARSRSLLNDEKGIIAVSSAMTIPTMLIGIFLLIEFTFYFMGMLETNFITLDLSKHLRNGSTVEAFFSEPRAMFEQMCVQSDGSEGYEVTLSQIDVSGHAYSMIEISCDWDFSIVRGILGLEDITPGFRYQAIFDADYAAEIAAREAP